MLRYLSVSLFPLIVSITLLSITLYSSFWSFGTDLRHASPRPSRMDISIRPVEADDLDAIVDIVIKVFPYDEQFAYRYPYREQYPEDHYKYTRMYYAQYLNTTFDGQNTIMVATAPDLQDSEKTKVIALSI